MGISKDSSLVVLEDPIMVAEGHTRAKPVQYLRIPELQVPNHTVRAGTLLGIAR